MKINQMEKTTNNQINKKEEIRILSRITPVPDICDHQNVEGQNGYFSLKKGWGQSHASFLINISNVHLDRGMVLGVNDAVTGGAFAGDVQVNVFACVVLHVQC